MLPRPHVSLLHRDCDRGRGHSGQRTNPGHSGLPRQAINVGNSDPDTEHVGNSDPDPDTDTDTEHVGDPNPAADAVHSSNPGRDLDAECLAVPHAEHLAVPHEHLAVPHAEHFGYPDTDTSAVSFDGREHVTFNWIRADDAAGSEHSQRGTCLTGGSSEAVTQRDLAERDCANRAVSADHLVGSGTERSSSSYVRRVYSR